MFGAEQVVYSGFFCEKQLPAAAKNTAMTALRVN